jgi:glucose-6-phosphate 1-epimerase
VHTSTAAYSHRDILTMHVLAPLALLLASVALPASAFSPHTFHIHHLSTSASRATAKGLRPTSVLSASRSTAKGLRRAAWTAGRTPAPPPPLPTINLAAGTSSATIYPFGACVTSYVRDGFDYLFVRPDAKLDGSKPISGGLPFCWPAFGPPSDQNAAVGELQQHGFARNLEWEVESSGGSSAVLTLAPNEYTRGMWDKEFKLTYV